MDHWLDRQVGRLRELALTLEPEDTRRPPPTGRADQRRSAFLAAVRELVEDVAAHDGVSACVACYDGLPMAAAGRAVDAAVEAVAAMAQRGVEAGSAAAGALALGPVQQVVVVGRDHKLALILVGQLVIGILAPVRTTLASTLAH
jgi:predicted regulator of Ras-like GTPase activity (Roadblock/LC7/MglB family)